MSLKLDIAAHTPTHIWGGGALENHQNLCHRNLTSPLNGYIAYILFSRVESVFSEGTHSPARKQVLAISTGKQFSGWHPGWRGSLFPRSLKHSMLQMLKPQKTSCLHGQALATGLIILRAFTEACFTVQPWALPGVGGVGGE